MITKTVRTKDISYEVVIGRDLLKNLVDYYPAPQSENACVLVVADETTEALYGEETRSGLVQMGYRVATVVFPPGEASKNAETLGKIHEGAYECGLTRKDHMLALGGGVVGDLTGFAAATWMRGIDYVQVPTTVLSQVDSSVGGKTGIDTLYGKNLIGAFKQPLLVLADTSTLETLPFEQIASGMAEVIKYGLLRGEEFFAEIEALPPEIPSDEIIAACIEQKAWIVEKDEKESGIRAFLNLGHTFGHAIEKAGGYTSYLHGEGVGLGMLAALRLGELCGLTPSGLLPRLQALLQRWQLPISTSLSLEQILPNIFADKKRQGSGIRFVLLEAIGAPILHWLGDEEIRDLAGALSGYLWDVPAEQPTEVHIRPGKIKGTVFPPPSKSQAHRVILATALATREADFTKYIRNFQEARSQDIDRTTENIRSLLAAGSETLELDCGESGSTIRFLIPIAAALGKSVRFTGHGRLPQRPLHAYRQALEDHGVTLTFPQEGFLPLLVEGQLKAGRYEIAGDSSSQYISGMLLAMCLLPEESELHLTTRLESAPYVDLTLETLRSFGQNIFVSGTERLIYRVKPTEWVLPQEAIEIERDYSQAAFWSLAQFAGQEIQIEGMREDSLQGDSIYANLLEQLGRFEAIDVSQFPDLFPALGLACALAGEGKVTHLTNAARLRIKESDRLATTAEMLTRLGVPVEIGEDWLAVTGVAKLKGAVLDSYGDHRLAMASAIAATVAEGESVLRDAGAVSKSYPSFYRELRRLGADLRQIYK